MAAVRRRHAILRAGALLLALAMLAGAGGCLCCPIWSAWVHNASGCTLLVCVSGATNESFCLHPCETREIDFAYTSYLTVYRGDRIIVDRVCLDSGRTYHCHCDCGGCCGCGQ
jgi:hypothetical protein